MNFRNWTISRKLMLLAFMNFAVLAGVVGFSNVTIDGLGNTLQKIGTNDIPAIRSMALTDMFHDGLRASVLRGFVGSYQNNKTELNEARKEYDEFSRDIEKHIKNIGNLNVSEATKKQAGDSVSEVKVYVAAGDKILKLLEAGRVNEAAVLQSEYQKSFEALEGKLEVLGNMIEKETAKSLMSDNEKAKQMGHLLALIGGLLSLIVPFLLGRNLVSVLNGIVQRMDQQKRALETYTVQIEKSAQDLSASSASQAAAIQESASAIEEISSMVARTAENSRNLATSAQQSDRTADDGRKAAATMLSEVDQIKVSNADVKAQVEGGNDEIEGIVNVIQEIGDKTKVINDIVFQTKLLSFNASVEAARAGEHGKGFAVVAEEVGNLAQMSGNAAKQITELLDRSTKQVHDIVVRNSEKVAVLLKQNSDKVDHGRRSAENCDHAFAQVASQVSEVRRLTGEITTAIQEQTTGLNEINKSIGLFNESTQENASSAQSASEVAGRLREQFIAVDKLMTELSSLIHGSKAA